VTPVDVARWMVDRCALILAARLTRRIQDVEGPGGGGAHGGVGCAGVGPRTRKGTQMTALDHEFATTFVIRHRAGSQEGAIFQRNEWDKLIAANGGEVVMARTNPDDAAGVGLGEFLGDGDDD
jgi:hypothetical protein